MPASWTAADRPLRPGGVALTDLAVVDLRQLDPRLRDTEIVVACDVDNPLTGPRGAARVYGPQKGASPDDVTALDAGLARLAQVLHRDLGIDVDRVPGAGAAGGVGAGALAFLGARLTPGIDLLLDLVGFDEALADADLVVTGEGSFDAQSLSGKAAVGVARRAVVGRRAGGRARRPGRPRRVRAGPARRARHRVDPRPARPRARPAASQGAGRARCCASSPAGC